MDSSTCLATKLIHDRIIATLSSDETRVLSLTLMNKEAVALARRGDHIGAIACLTVLLESSRERNVVHKELFVCLGNRSASYLALGLHNEALADARLSVQLIESALPGWGS